MLAIDGAGDVELALVGDVAVGVERAVDAETGLGGDGAGGDDVDGVEAVTEAAVLDGDVAEDVYWVGYGKGLAIMVSPLAA